MDKNDLLTIRTLTGLMHDSALGYAAASRHAESQELKTFLRDISVSRASNAIKLVGLLRKNDVSIPLGGTMFGGLHRAWMALRDFLSSTDDVNMLAECARGESYLVGRFDEALGHGRFPMELLDFLHSQREELMADFLSIQHMDSQLTDIG